MEDARHLRASPVPDIGIFMSARIRFNAADAQAAYHLALSRPATPAEMVRAPVVSKERNLTSVCWALLNSTEFVYVR
jgi:hypothetical protein